MVDEEKERQTESEFSTCIRVDSWEYFRLCAIDMGHSAKVHKRMAVSLPPSQLCHPPIVCTEKDRHAAKISRSTGAICSVGQETRRLEVQNQGHGVGWCRLCDVDVGRSERGSRGGSQASTGMIVTT